MKATELRLGNLVSSMYEKTARVREIHEHPSWAGGFLVITDENKSAITTLRPISLTPEWLEKLGALKDEHGDVFIEVDSDSDTRLYLSTRGYMQLVKSYHCPMFDYEHIRYVHQLQNLFFCLCGEELHIKK